MAKKWNKKRSKRRQKKEKQQKVEAVVEQDVVGYGTEAERLVDKLPGIEHVAALLDGEGDVDFAQKLMPLLVDSYELGDEPEFADIYFEPLRTTEVVGEQLAVLGYDFDSFAEIGTVGEQLGVKFECYLGAVPTLLTAEIEGELKKGVLALNRRWQEEGHEQAAKSAAVALALLSDVPPAMWATAGFVHFIVDKSLGRDEDLLADKIEAGEDVPFEGGTLVTGIRGNEALLDGVLAGMPDMSDYYEREQQRAWEQGLQALFSGEVYLGIFGEAELIEVGESMQPLFVKLGKGKNREKTMQEIWGKAGQFVAERFDEERQGMLAERLRAKVKGEEEREAGWLLFYGAVIDVLAKGERQHILTLASNALLGEVNRLAQETLAKGKG
ncbi:MAG TPA: hypothetical protein VLL52_06705 [Anaerolineae bacterium]|nr:hypothetical protein [Anaerolineae bacterium]